MLPPISNYCQSPFHLRILSELPPPLPIRPHLPLPGVRDQRLCTQLFKHFNEKIEIVEQALDHGIRKETLAIEKYQFILNYRLNRLVKITEAGIIIQSQLFWLGDSSDGVIL